MRTLDGLDLLGLGLSWVREDLSRAWAWRKLSPEERYRRHRKALIARHSSLSEGLGFGLWEVSEVQSENWPVGGGSVSTAPVGHAGRNRGSTAALGSPVAPSGAKPERGADEDLHAAWDDFNREIEEKRR